MKNQIDTIDMSILRNLQEHGRMTNIRLADNAGISAPPCLRRLRRLEKLGIILGYYASINHVHLGYGFASFCFISLSKQTSKCHDDFIQYVRNIPEIRQCIATNGEFDFILKIVAHDFAEYDTFLNEKIKKYCDIINIKSFPITHYYKDKKGIPI